MKRVKEQIKAVFLDMDGTLVAYPRGEIPLSAQSALAGLRAAGILICAATGRSRMEMESLDFLGEVPLDAVAAVNGQYCYTREKELYSNVLSAEDLAAFMDFQKIEPVPAVIVEKNRMYVNFTSPDFKSAMATIATELPPCADMNHFEAREVLQLVPYCSAQTVAALEAKLVSAKAVRWSPEFVDIIPADGGKVKGIESILDHFGIGWEETIAFGDGQNDIAMIEAAKIGVAMGNAAEEVKRAADYVTSGAEQDGIASALAYFGLID